MLALIDGDIVAYSAAAAANKVYYVTPDGLDFRYKKEAVGHCRETGLPEEEIEKYSELDPPEFALANAKRIINKIMERTECTDYTIYLSGEENFRRELAESYKANRNETAKPAHLEAVKDYLIQHHDAEVTHSKLEADDFIGMAAGDHAIICTLDKDLDQIAGAHYNWMRDEMYHVNSSEAELWFWMQMLMGDRADNIEGVRGIGERTAWKLLVDVPSNKRRCVVGLEYAKAFDDPEEMMRVNALLLWIQR